MLTGEQMFQQFIAEQLYLANRSATTKPPPRDSAALFHRECERLRSGGSGRAERVARRVSTGMKIILRTTRDMATSSLQGKCCKHPSHLFPRCLTLSPIFFFVFSSYVY